jgi:hypothetical protein
LSGKRSFCKMVKAGDFICILGDCLPDLHAKAEAMGGKVMKNGLSFLGLDQDEVVDLCAQYFDSIKTAKA